MFSYMSYGPAERSRDNNMQPPTLQSVSGSVSNNIQDEEGTLEDPAPLSGIYRSDPQTWTRAQLLMGAHVTALIDRAQSHPFYSAKQVIAAVTQMIDKYPEYFRADDDVVRSSIEVHEDDRPSG
jgi:hypothetical protein